MTNSVAQFLKKNKDRLLDTWTQKQLASDTLRDDLMSNDELRLQSEELVNLLVKTVNDENINQIESSRFDELFELLSGISMSRARQGFSPRETGLYIFSLKDAIFDLLQQDLSSDPVQLFEISLKFNRLLDSFGVVTFETFIKGREEVIFRQTEEISDISTPVIQVWDGILALPIIGTLDSARTQVVMESLLQKIVDTGSSIAILDISGVPAVDSLVAQHLIKTVSATRLMGADCIISGIRPEIAQTVVHLGIDLSNIITKATLASALKHAFNMNKLTVKRAEPEKKFL
ncbi:MULTISPECIES: STAS domain-containing protein [unclassified Spirosoma]|uniref:STAS domain-containing protein n=1 Tax=unclassified Spirosoma TaxID=2621999 RepID=UPI000965FAAD|nr:MULTISPECIES: STAS domain-containing protein [unclassified Spirosoma]MBN8824176.1 STAS domain-containing protein [Spirosoma sp.]OJW78913.1 MAG: anti-anti-sigma factor [Spirosoma sp. 48-14]